MPTAAPKSKGVAVILQFLIPGLGHLYTGNPLSAIFWFASAFIGWMLVAAFGLGIVLLVIVYPLAMIHAYMSAGNFNRRHHAVR
jgi:TM2 domain-containing membrane protein YozV